VLLVVIFFVKMNPVLFKIGSVDVYTHGLFLVLAVLSASVSVYILAQKSDEDTAPVLDLVIYTALFGIIGARLAYVAVYYSYFNSPVEALKIWEGGLVSWGGYFLGAVAYLLVIKFYKKNTLKWLDILTVSTMLGIAVGRIGCFISGELYGVPYTGFGSVRGIFPATLAESLYAFGVFIVLALIFIRWNKSGRGDGLIFFEGLILYSGGRFVLDFMRSGEKLLQYFNANQIAELAVFILASIAFYLTTSGTKKGGHSVIG
jgi:phosphatidylglycerol:prolipoprotein diacylglycerol transferase